MIKGLFLYLKDKNFFKKKENLQLIGGIKDIEKIVKELDIKLLHIVDIDLTRRKIKNYDLYDKLTTFTHVQVETNNVHVAKKLQEINVRIVLVKPYLDHKDYEALDKKFLAIRIEENEYVNLITSGNINDVVTSNNNIAEIVLSRRKRLFFIGKHEKAFCNIMVDF